MRNKPDYAMKNCEICYKAFKPNAPSQRCCCEECSKENLARYQHDWYLMRPKKRKRTPLEREIKKLDKYNKEHGAYHSYGWWQTQKFFGKLKEVK